MNVGVEAEILNITKSFFLILFSKISYHQNKSKLDNPIFTVKSTTPEIVLFKSLRNCKRRNELYYF